MIVMYKYTYWLIHKSAFTEYTHQIYTIWTWCEVLYDPQMNWIITKQSSQNDLFVDVSRYPCIDT